MILHKTSYNILPEEWTRPIIGFQHTPNIQIQVLRIKKNDFVIFPNLILLNKLLMNES